MVSRDPSSTLIAKPHSVERGAGLGRDLGQEQDSAWSGGRTQRREGAGLSMEWGLGRDLGWGQDSAWSRDWAETWAEGRTQHGQGTGLSVDGGRTRQTWAKGRTQHGAVAGLSVERWQDSRIWGPAHAPQDHRGQQVPLSYP